MKIGIITTWFERGAAYVSRAYMQSLQNQGHTVYIYARGGEKFAKDDLKWNLPNVEWDSIIGSDRITPELFFSWIDKTNIDILFFNEQRHFEIIALTKKRYPEIKIGAYVDYYTEPLLGAFQIMDFVVCNTKRHYEAMDNHPQRYYLRWGTDIDLYKPIEKTTAPSLVTFFHSVGMAPRKGTDILLKTFIDGKLYEKSKLIIHTQIPIEKVTPYTKEDLLKYSNIEIIEKTVTAPGLYYLGDVYVYPTRVDGLGLTMYEALASGLPVITTNYPPMNEIIDNNVGKLVDVERLYCRGDAYYWPMARCSEESLLAAMNYYIANPNIIFQQSKIARERAIELYDWKKQEDALVKIFENVALRTIDSKLIDKYLPEPTPSTAKKILRRINNLFK